jgi:flagellar basal-body rod modification protein FlgD
MSTSLLPTALAPAAAASPTPATATAGNAARPAAGNLATIPRSSTPAPPEPLAIGATDKMDRSAFLTLFTTQLMNQNPLDPVKNEAFVAQLAQFSQLEATTNMADSLAALTSSLQGDRLMAGAALIGRKVASPSGQATLGESGGVSGVVSVPQGASSVRLDVFDATGRKVHSRELGRQAPGEVLVGWDGKDANGARMPAGRYRVVATVDSFGQITQLPIGTPATVRSVAYSPAEQGLVLELDDGALVPLSQVRRIDG